MLVCSVSQSQRRAAIAAGVVEAAAALDAPGTGNVVFATLVDDPASVGDRVDAYLGQIMREVASASATVNAGLAYAATITEAGTAADVASASIPIMGTVAETATAADAPTATIVPGVSSVTWDSATVTAVTLSGGNLVATNTGTSSADQGAHVVSTSGKTSGKYYFEVTLTAKTGGGNVGAGIGTTASTYTGMGNSATSGVECFLTGTIWANGTNTGENIGTLINGTVVGIAVDLANRKIWFRVSPAGNWYGNVNNNPVTNVGGVTVPAGTMVPFVTFGGSGGAANNVTTTNFGATSFVGAVPSGFTSGWPI